jgi:hypothetical protein
MGRSTYRTRSSKAGRVASDQLSVALTRDFSNAPRRTWRVLPVEVGDQLYWVDPAGFHLATCPRPERWEERHTHAFDFLLDPFERVVSPDPYV